MTTRERRKTSATAVPPTTPPRMTLSEDGDSLSNHPVRGRANSREYVGNYDKTFGGQDDMVAVDIALHSGASWEANKWSLFVCYVIGVIGMGVVVMMMVSLVDSKLGGTVTNVLHFFVTLYYLHWAKGGLHEDSGELDHLTLWEQIDATPRCANLRLGLRVVPTVLCYLACLEAGWNVGWKDAWFVCSVNVVAWGFGQLGKMPFMNGRRLWGINANPLLEKEQ